MIIIIMSTFETVEIYGKTIVVTLRNIASINLNREYTK